MMSQEIRKRMKDCSTDSEFRFKILCSSCGSWHHSKPIPFSYAEAMAKESGKKAKYDALYRREWQAALDNAVKDAVNQFSICPICHGAVCDKCFMICDEIDMCRNCAGKLNEHGTPVLSGVANMGVAL